MYGRYALVAALTVVFAACSTLAVNEIMGRHGALLALRLGSGLAAAVAFGILTTLWLALSRSFWASTKRRAGTRRS